MSTDNNISNNVISKMTIKKASKYLGVSEYYLRKGVDDNTIPYFKSGNRVYILIDVLKKQLENKAQNQMINNYS